VLRFLDKNFEGRIPEIDPAHVEALDREILTACGSFEDPAIAIREFRFRRAAEQLLANATVANVFVDRTAPWALRKTDPALAASTLNTACEWLSWIARWMAPMMPNKAQDLWRMLGQEGEVSATPWPGLPAAGTWRSLKGGSKLGEVSGLFPKLEDAVIAAEIEALAARSAT
jgi:methionyl-tRNA synthetase